MIISPISGHPSARFDNLEDKYKINLLEKEMNPVVKDAIRGIITESVRLFTINRLPFPLRPLVSLATSSSSLNYPWLPSSLISASSSSPASSSSSSSSSLSSASSSSLSSSSSNLQTSGSVPLAVLSYLNPVAPFQNTFDQIKNFNSAIRTMRANWAKRNQEQQQQLRKRLAWIAKRLTNTRLLSGTLHRFSSRKDSKPYINSMTTYPNQIYNNQLEVPF